MKTAWALGWVLAIAGRTWGWAPDGDETPPAKSAVETLSEELRAQRVELEAQRAQIEALKSKRAAMSLEGSGEPPVQEKKAEAPKGEFELRTSFEGDGLFHLKSVDGGFDLHVGGRFLEEYRHIADRPVGPAGLTVGAAARAPADTFYTREVFLSIDGTLWKDWGFKVNFDAAAGANLLEEGFMEWKHFKEFRLQLGQFKVPQSYEYMGSPRFLEEIQRTAMSRLNPGIEMGIMATGNIADGILNYWLGASNGRGHLNNNGRSVVDDNDAKEFEAKLAISPWAPDKESFLKKLRFGGYFTRDLQGMGSPAGTAPAGSVAIGNVNTNEFGTTWITLPGGAYGDRTRYGAELLYAYGPFGMRAEIQKRTDRFQDAAGTIDEKLPFLGYYLTGTWLLTGEDKTVTTRVNPARPLDFEGGWGALELVVRYAVCSVDNDTFKEIGGNQAPGANTNRVSALTAGFNWWTTQNTRISMDYVAELFNDPLQFEADKNRSSLGGFLARFQIDF